MNPEKMQAVLTDGGEVALQQHSELEVKHVDPDKIAVDEQNERQDEPLETEGLEQSVKKNGVVEPPVCRIRDSDARVPYSVVQGQRRVAAAQAVQLDEIPILVGEFDDMEALIRSISENMASGRKEVTTQTRAAAIWELWKLDAKRRGIDLDEGTDEYYPNAQRIARLLGVPTKTASRWIEPLKKEFVGTEMDPRVKLNNGEMTSVNSAKIADISPKKLSLIRNQLSGGGEEAVEIVRRVQEEDLSIEDVQRVAEESPSYEDAEQAIEAVVRANEAVKGAKGYLLDQMQFGSETSDGLRRAATETGQTRQEVVMNAVQYYLRNEGYL